MRDIKFRAWDNKNLGWCRYTNSDCMNNLQNKNVNIMQYTGLKDKNGKEIYEGDIVDFGGTKHKIVFDRGCFYMEDSKEPDMVPWILDIKHSDMAEVIGNIYENPEKLGMIEK